MGTLSIVDFTSVSPLVPSEQQTKFYEWIEFGKGSAILVAVAGAGKSTSLREGMKYMKGTVVSMAFSKDIVKEAKHKLPLELKSRVTVGTFHSVGRSAWKKVAPQVKLEDKDRDGYTKAEFIADKLFIPWAYRPFVAKAVRYAKQRGFGIIIHLMNKAEWLDLVDHFDMRDLFANEDGDLPDNIEDVIGEALNWTVKALRYGIKIARELIDFEDMLYMPLVGKCALWQYDWVLVDEAQDTNPVRRLFARRLLKKTGRAVFVGDPHQAIFGFTGADAQSLPNIKKEFKCVELPLTVSFRCSQEVVKRAQTWVNHIQASPLAIVGSNPRMQNKDFRLLQFSPKDAILCRNTAPLVELTLGFLARGQACHIEGKDIGANLITLIKRFPNIKTLPALASKLDEYVEKKCAKLMKEGKDAKAGELEDTADAVQAMLGSMPAGSSVYDLTEKIRKMFTDHEGEQVETLTLSTIHKAKGREWTNVYWYGNNVYQPSSYAKKDWQVEQEDNLMYVASTRAKDSLIEVAVDPRTLKPRKRKAA